VNVSEVGGDTVLGWDLSGDGNFDPFMIVEGVTGLISSEMVNSENVLFYYNNASFYGSHQLTGGDGVDYLYGDFADNVLIGGEGADEFNPFVYKGVDTIADFSVLDLREIVLDFIQAQDDISQFLNVSEVDGDTVLGWDLSGDGNFDPFLILDGVTGVVGSELENSDNVLFFYDNLDYGSQLLTGGDGNDQLYGDDADNVIRGGAGDDYISSHAGDDILYGDEGADTFFITSHSDGYLGQFLGGFDTIKDFSVEEGDKLDLSDLLEGYDVTNEAIADFIQVTEADGNTVVGFDITGQANFETIAIVEGVTGVFDQASLTSNENIIL
jgi:surface adhesion protein